MSPSFLDPWGHGSACHGNSGSSSIRSQRGAPAAISCHPERHGGGTVSIPVEAVTPWFRFKCRVTPSAAEQVTGQRVRLEGLGAAALQAPFRPRPRAHPARWVSLCTCPSPARVAEFLGGAAVRVPSVR